MKKCDNKKCKAYNEEYGANCELNGIVDAFGCQEYEAEAIAECEKRNGGRL